MNGIQTVPQVFVNVKTDFRILISVIYFTLIKISLCYNNILLISTNKFTQILNLYTYHH